MSSSIFCDIINKEFGYNYTTLIPCNLFGEHDNFDKNKSHLIPSIIRKSYDYKLGKIKKISIWGNGQSKREFLYVDNLSLFIKKMINHKIKDSFINVGCMTDLKVIEYYKLIWRLMDIKPNFEFEYDKPNGVKRKLLDSTLAIKKYGYTIKKDLKEGLEKTIKFYAKHYVK